MDIEKLIEDLRGLLKQYGEKIPYGELVGAPWPYSRAGDLVWQDPEPYFIEQAATALSTLKAENEKLRAEMEQKSKLIAQQAAELERRDTLLKDQEAELERVKRERDAAVDCCSGYCASCLFVKDCAKHDMNDAAPTRWYYGDCEDWEWHGQKED